MRKCRREDENNDEFGIVRGSGNVFKDLGFDDEEAANLLVRADLMIEIVKIIDERGWTPQEAARALGVAQTRISELRKGKMKEFSVDLLLKYLARLGKRVEFAIQDEVA
jgi:predicted XRE-type DNA-binding protein